MDFLDSTGLGALVGSLKRLRRHQRSLKLVTNSGRILELFNITGLSRAFVLHRSVLDAISGDEHWQAALAGEGPITGEQSTGEQSAEEQSAEEQSAEEQSAEEWCRRPSCRSEAGSGGFGGFRSGRIVTFGALPGSAELRRSKGRS